MAIQRYWGSNPITTTVSAAPAPTTTVFTVLDITDFLDEQFILVEVAGGFERVQIDSILGSQITLKTPLSAVPDTPGAVKSGRELVSNSKLNLSGAFHSDTTTELEALDVANAPDKTRYYVPDYGTFHLDKGSSEPADGEFVLNAAGGSGRWIRNPVRTSATSARFTQSGHGFAVKDIVRHNGSTWVKAQGNTIANATCVWVVVEVPDVNNFTIIKKGRVTVPGHGLTVGTLYYLSHTTPGSITSTKPQGDLSTRVDLHLPVIYVESANVIHVIGQDYPTLNREIVNHQANSSNVFQYLINSIDYDETGPFTLEMSARVNAATSLDLRPNSDSSAGNYKHQRTEFNGSTITGTDSHSPIMEIGDSISTGIMLTVDVTKRFNGTYHMQYHLTSEEPRDYRGTLIWVPTINMTSLQVLSSSTNLNSAHIRVYRKDR